MDYYNRRTNFNRPIPIMCKYFKYGDCYNGDNCHYMHASLCRDDGRCKDDNCNKSHVKQRDPSTYLKNVRRFQPNQFRRSPNRRSRSHSRSSRSRSRSSYGSPGRRSKSPSFSPKKISRRRSRSKSDYGYQKRSDSPPYVSSKRISTSPFFNPMKEKGKRRSHSFSPVPARRKHTASPTPLRREHSVSPPPSRKKHSSSPSQSRKKRSVSSASSGSTSSTGSSSSGSMMITKSKSFPDKSEKGKKRKVVKKVKDSQTQNGSTVDDREENSRDVLIIKQESPADLYDCLDEKPSPKNKKDAPGFKPIGEVLPTRASIDSKGKDLAQMLATESEYSPSTRALHILKNLPKDFFDAPKVPVKESSDTDQEAFREAFLKALSSTELASSANVAHHKEKTMPSMMRHPLNAESLAKPFQDKLYGVEATNVDTWTPATDRSNKTKTTKHGGPKNASQSISNWEVDTPYVARNKHGEVTHASLSTTATSIEGKMLPPPSKSKRQAAEPKKKKKKHHRQISSSSSATSTSGDENENLVKEDESKVVEIGDKEREEALDKKKDILSRVWTLMGQKKKLEMQRDEIALNHKGEGKSLSALLQENSILSTEIDKQIYIMNQMVQIINGRLGISKNETHMQDFYYQPKLFGDSELPTLFLKQYSTENLEKSVNLYLKAPEDANKNVSDSQSMPKRQKKSEKSKSRSRSRSKDRKRSKSAEHKSKKHNKDKKQKKDKSPSLESQKSSAKKDKKKESRKTSTSSKVKPKTTGEVEYAPSPAMKPHVKYIDQGMHWCKICNDFQETVPDYIVHLQSGPHVEKLTSDPKSWLPEPSKIEKEPFRPGAPVITIPLKGMEFTHSMTAFYCSLCDVFMKSKEEAEAHGETKIHVSKYKEYLSANPMYETSYVKDKMAAYAKYSVEKERSRERASTLEDTNQEAFFCEVKKKIGVDLSSQNSISFEEETSNDDTFNNSEEIVGEYKGINDYICADEISKIDNEDNERKEIASELGSLNNMDEDTKNDDDWGEVLEETLINEENVEQGDENMKREHLDVGEHSKQGMEKERQAMGAKEIQGVEEKGCKGIDEKENIDIEFEDNQSLEENDGKALIKNEADQNMEKSDGFENKVGMHIHEDNMIGKGVNNDKDTSDHSLSKVLGDHNKKDCDNGEIKGNCHTFDMIVKEDLKDEKCSEDISAEQINADKVEKRKAKNDKKEEKRTRKKERRGNKAGRDDEDDTSNSSTSKKNINTASIRVSSRSFSSSNMQTQKESSGSNRDAHKSRSSKHSDDFGYYKEKRLSVEEEEKIKALKERIKKKENMENEEPSDEELDSNETDKQKKKLSNVMIGKMPFLKRSKSSNIRNELNKSDLNGNQLSVTAAEERIRKMVSEGINSNLQNSEENKMEIDSKSIPLSVYPNVEYITEIQSSGDESMFKIIGHAVQKEEVNNESNIPQKVNNVQMELNNLQNKEVTSQLDEIKAHPSVQQNLDHKTFNEIPVPQTNYKSTLKNIEDISSANTNMSSPNQHNTNTRSNTTSNNESFVPELKPPPAPFISVQANMASNHHIVLPDLRKPPPNMVQHNLATPPSQQRSMVQNNFSTVTNQHMIQHNLPLPPPNFHMMGANLPVPPPGQHMIGHNLSAPPPGQHMLGHNLTTPPPTQHLMGHNLTALPPNQHLMGHNLTVPPPNQNYSPLNQQVRRMDFAMSPQNSSMVGSMNSNYSMSPQISPAVGPPNSNFPMAPQNPRMVGPPNSNFSMSQNSPMMGQFRPNSDFSGSTQNPIMGQNNSMMDQNYQTKSKTQMTGSNLPLPPTPPEIGINNYGESSIIMKPPPPPFNFKPLTPPPKLMSTNNPADRLSKIPSQSVPGTKVANDSTITELSSPKETLSITPAMNSCLNSFFATILDDDIPSKTAKKNVPAKNVKVKASKKVVPLKSSKKVVPLKSSKKVPVKTGSKDVRATTSSEDVPIKTSTEDAPMKSCTKTEQRDVTFETAESLEEPDTLVQEGLELLEFAEETGTSPKPNINLESDQDGILVSE